MKQKVFISYAAPDREFAELIKSNLDDLLSTQTTPVNTWAVQPNLEVGEVMRKSIKAAMDAASIVVIISSPDGDTSQWVNYEAGLADALGKKIVIIARKGKSKSALLDRFRDSAMFIQIDDVAKPSKNAVNPSQKTSEPKAEKGTGEPASKVKSAPKKRSKESTITPEERYHMIATAAYWRAEQRGFPGGYEIEDWISAEEQIAAMLKD